MGGVSSTNYAGDTEDMPTKGLPNPIFSRGKPLSTTSRVLPRRRAKDESLRVRRNSKLVTTDDSTSQTKTDVRREFARPSDKFPGPRNHSESTDSDSLGDVSSIRRSRMAVNSCGRDRKLWESAAAWTTVATTTSTGDGDSNSTSTAPPVQQAGETGRTDDVVLPRTSRADVNPYRPDDDDGIFQGSDADVGNIRNGSSETRHSALPTQPQPPTLVNASVGKLAPNRDLNNCSEPDINPNQPLSPGSIVRRRYTAGVFRSSVCDAMAPTIQQHSPFGDLIPWGDPSWYRGDFTPYYTASHVTWRARVREFVEHDIIPNTHEWDENKAMPKEIFRKAAQAGLLACTVGVPWPTEYAGPGPEGFDYFHELILIDELSRCGSGGVVWGLFGGLSIGLPPIVNFASKALKDRVVPECLNGDKVICLAISEPYAGSDVANLKCTAEKTPDGRHFIVNGEKKWITNGVFADYFTVAVRTGGKGAGGLSLLLIERGMEGITTQQMKCTGVWPSGTAYITFDDVKVPVENLIGAENQGFKFIMYNFNHERWSLICQASRFARVCLEESFKFASKRATFGKKLLEHPVIRWKIAEMARQVEATHAQLELLTLQMNAMSKLEAMEQLGGPLALLKVQSTKVFEYCAREAAQIFGGSSYVRGGQGEKVERLYREVRAYAIPGGSEEIMLDLAVRQAMKAYAQGPRSKM